MSTSVIGENHYVRANTKALFSSLIHIPIPTMSRVSEKEASTLHLYLMGGGVVVVIFIIIITTTIIIIIINRCVQIDNFLCQGCIHSLSRFPLLLSIYPL